MKKIVIVGGGTAGWLTALIAKQFHPSYNITLVESDEIGILGAGEGTVPHFTSVLEFLNIPVSYLIKEASATLKLGINFKNWNGDNKEYFHGFMSHNGVEDFNLGDYFYLNQILITKYISKNGNLDDISFQKKLCDNNKVPFSYKNSIETQFSDPVYFLDQHAGFALHFDARKLAIALKNLAISRGISRVEGKLKSIKSDDQGQIQGLKLENGVKLPLDFVFDCTGFARILIGKHFETKWKSYKENLPLDTAIPFFIEHNNDISPKTDAIAMKYGWVWKIPVQGRYGCGYVFDSNFTNEDVALKELENYFRQPITSPKTFRFDAGTFEETLVKNCMAVGLSQSFIEPLEATSIWISCQNLIEFFRSNGINNRSLFFTEKFNKQCLQRNAEVVEFLYLHYMTRRNDSEFWKNFRHNNKAPDRVLEFLDLLNETHTPNLENHIFPLKSWVPVANGLGLLNRVKYQKICQDFGLGEELSNNIIPLKKNQDLLILGSLTHKEFINHHLNYS